jgi:hypothetical protein
MTPIADLLRWARWARRARNMPPWPLAEYRLHGVRHSYLVCWHVLTEKARIASLRGATDRDAGQIYCEECCESNLRINDAALICEVYVERHVVGRSWRDGRPKVRLVWTDPPFVIGMSDYHFRHEPVLHGWIENGPHYFTDDRTQDSVFEVDKPHSSDLVSTMKPVELVARMIVNSSRAGDLVWDSFLGSGTTLLAAHQLERIGYGAEVDPANAGVCLERLAALGLEPKLIDG